MLTKEEVKERQNFIGGSDIPIIMGLSNYKTPYMLYLEKKGIIEPEEDDPNDRGPRYWGKLIEPALRQSFERKYNVKAPQLNKQVHPSYAYMRGNLDGYINDWGAVWEGKISTVYKDRGEDGTDFVEPEYLVQTAFYVNIMAEKKMPIPCDRAYITMNICNREEREFMYVRDLDMEKIILDCAIDFKRFLDNSIEPEALNIADCKLKYKTPHTGEMIKSSTEILQMVTDLSAIKAQIKEFEEMEKHYKFEIMQYMKTAECLTDNEDNILISWKPNKKGSRIFLVK